MTRHSLLGVCVMAVALAGSARAHDEGPPGFPCTSGPFGVPGPQLPADQIGQWGPVLTWPLQATHAALLHTGMVLFYRGADPLPISTYTWDPGTEAISGPFPVTSDIFCSGHAALADGRILVMGGARTPVVPVQAEIFDPLTESWTPAADMAYGRYYPTATTLPDGRILASSGDPGVGPYSDIQEVYDVELDTWTPLFGAQRSLPLYPFLFLQDDGRVLFAGNNTIARPALLDVGAETWELLAPANHWEGSSAAMFRMGRVLKIGGNVSGPQGAVAFAEVLDATLDPPAWHTVAPLAYPRDESELVLLPDGKVLAVGGAVDGLDSPECAVHTPELWDPDSETWTEMASAARPRNYHSSALLLPDGRVAAMGGENSHTLGGEKNAEVYSPPYLFQGPRPVVTSAPGVLDYGQHFTVATPDAASIASVVLMRPGAATHAFDQSQSYLPLVFTALGAQLVVTAPPSANHAPPGYYMLFLVDGNGVPSVAPFVRLRLPGTPFAQGIPAVPAPGLALAAFGIAAALAWTLRPKRAA